MQKIYQERSGDCWEGHRKQKIAAPGKKRTAGKALRARTLDWPQTTLGDDARQNEHGTRRYESQHSKMQHG